MPPTRPRPDQADDPTKPSDPNHASRPGQLTDRREAIPPDDVLRPLSHYLRGELHLVFEGGVELRREMSHYDARGVLAKQAGQRSDDSIDWRSAGWLTWQNARLLASAFDLAADQQWPCSPSERARLEEGGHPQGILHSLLELWRSARPAREPLYSVKAIATLEVLARTGATRATWETYARQLEGQAGVRALLLALTAEAPRRQAETTRPSRTTSSNGGSSGGSDERDDADPADPHRAPDGRPQAAGDPPTAPGAEQTDRESAPVEASEPASQPEPTADQEFSAPSVTEDRSEPSDKAGQ